MSNAPRPVVDREMILSAATEVAKLIDGNANDIAAEYRHPMDGYELAKSLDNHCLWDIRAMDVEELDGMSSIVESRLRNAEKNWFAENDIQPPLPVGTRIEEGIITGVCDHSPGRYLVKENGCTHEGRSLLIKFENAIACENGGDAERFQSGRERDL